MKFLAFSVLVLSAVVYCKEEKVQEKRGAPTAQVYSKSVLQDQSQLLRYTAQQPETQQQTQYITSPQVQYEADSQIAGKVQKLAAPQYSLAGDVSSFSYSSPVVQYNSLGLLNLNAGKAASTPVHYAAAPAPKTTYQPQQIQYQPQQIQYQPQQIQSQPQTLQKYVFAPTQIKTAAPQAVQYSAPQQLTYSAAPQPQYQQYQTAQQPQYQQYQAAPSIQQPVLSAAPQYYNTAPQYLQQKYLQPYSQ